MLTVIVVTDVCTYETRCTSGNLAFCIDRLSDYAWQDDSTVLTVTVRPAR